MTEQDDELRRLDACDIHNERSLRRWKRKVLKDASDPSVSDGTSGPCEEALTDLQKKVLEGLRQGFSSRKIADLYGLSVHSVKYARQVLHRKGFALLPCTPPEGRVGRTISHPQVHNFVVEVALPWGRGSNVGWRGSVKKERLADYRRFDTVSGYQEMFSLLDGRVMVRSTHRSCFLTVKGCWGSSFEEARRSAWELAVRASEELQAVYCFVFGAERCLRFKGAEWACVGHEVARRLDKERSRVEIFVNGRKSAWNDSTPDKSWEFSRQRDAEVSARDEKARVYAGLTNEALAVQIQGVNTALLDVAQKLGILADSQTNVTKMIEFLIVKNGSQTSQSVMQSEKKLERPSYVG